MARKSTEKQDRLGEMVSLQRGFHEIVERPLKSASFAEREAMIARNCRNVIVEAVETMNCVNWKEWKKTKVEVNWPHLKEEIADQFIFVLNQAIESGMDAEELYRVVKRKVAINAQRQKDNY